MADQSNEIIAVPTLLLKQLAIKGCLVTADAMSCQKKIAHQIVSQEADDLLAVKANQKTLFNAIDRHFTHYWDDHPENSPDDEQHTQQHGRTECRRVWVAPMIEDADEVLHKPLLSIGKWRTHCIGCWMWPFVRISRVQDAAENLATARQIALNLLKQDTTTKLGIKNRRKACGWSERPTI